MSDVVWDVSSRLRAQARDGQIAPAGLSQVPLTREEVLQQGLALVVVENRTDGQPVPTSACASPTNRGKFKSYQARVQRGT